jgi:adenylyltransferase/sulfurtransferase
MTRAEDLPVALREDQIRRYARHVLLPDVGGHGQARLLAASVAVELGPGRVVEAVALAYLAAAGVGRILLCGDPAGPLGPDEIAGGVLWSSADLGRPRGAAARSRIAALNPDVEVIDVAGGALGAEALRLSEELEPVGHASSGGAGFAVADGLARAGAAVARVLVRIARRPA